MSLDRRAFVSLGSLGLAAGASALTLPVCAQPTEGGSEVQLGTFDIILAKA